MAVTNNLTLIHACETATDATTGCVMDGGASGSYLGGVGEFVQGTYGYGFDLDIETLTERFTPTASLNLSGQTVWVWLRCLTNTFLDTWQNGGVSVLLSDGTNTSTWYLDGYGKGSTYQRHAFSTSSTPDAISGTLTLTAVTYIEISFTGVTKSKLPENIFIDYLQYGPDGTGITVTGGTSGTPETFADVYGDDVTAAAGMIAETDGIYYLNGPIEFGETVGSPETDTYFKDTNQVLSSISHYRSFTTANRTTAESLVASSHNTINVVGSTTTTTSFVFGEKTGSLGYAGDTSKTGGNRKIIITCTDANVNTFQIYGSNFINCGAISLPTVSGTAKEVISSNFNTCDQIDPSTCVFNNNIIAGTNDASGALLLDSSGTTNQTDLTFIFGGGLGSPLTEHAIEIIADAVSGSPLTGSYDLTNVTYTGYGADGTTTAAIYNNSGGEVTLNILGGDTPTVLNGAGSTTIIQNAVTVRVQSVTEGTAVKVVANETVGTITTGDTIFEKLADSNGVAEITDFNYEAAFDGGSPENTGLAVIIRARNSGFPTAAIQDDNSSYTDETTESNSATSNDMNLLPAVPVVNEDGYIFGHAEKFDKLKLWINTAGTGGFTITWQYWSGGSPTGWTNLSGVSDGTSSFSLTGENTVSWTIPGDWATTTINSQGPYYYVRALYTAGSVGTVPTGTRTKLDVTRYLPFVQNNAITSSGLTVTASWQEDTIANF